VKWVSFDYLSSGRERWDRLATVTLWIGLLFVASTVYGAVDGDDVYGLANTLLPALLCLGMWRVAVWRRDR
jgi:hypothetical protein